MKRIEVCKALTVHPGTPRALLAVVQTCLRMPLIWLNRTNSPHLRSLRPDAWRRRGVSVWKEVFKESLLKCPLATRTGFFSPLKKSHCCLRQAVWSGSWVGTALACCGWLQKSRASL